MSLQKEKGLSPQKKSLKPKRDSSRKIGAQKDSIPFCSAIC